MGGGQLACRTVGATKYNRHTCLSSKHISDFGSVVQYLIRRQYCKVEGHELHNRPKAFHCSSDTNTSETELGNWRINYPFESILIQQAFTYLEIGRASCRERVW